MSTKLSEIQVLFQTRNARQRGPTSSDQFNDMVAEIAHDLSTLNDQWNNRLIPLITPVPDGTSDVSIDAYANGLDGANLLVKQDASNTTYSTYYNSASTRPNSVYEQFAEVYSNINVIRDDLEYQITNITSSASQLSIADSASLYDSTNVEDALAEVMLTANSAAASSINNLQEAFDGGQSITVSDGDDQTLTFNQNDITNNPNAVVINNTGTGINLLLSSSSDSATKLSISNSDSGHTFQAMVTGTAASIGADKFSIYDNIAAAHRFVIDSSGQVGINNSAPGAALDVVGNVELEDTTASSEGVVLKGGTIFLHNFHHATGGGAVPLGNNVFLGEAAGNFTIGSTATQDYHGSNNVGIGSNTLDALTTGFRNIAVGYNTLTACTDASSNVGVGHRALEDITTGTSNIGIGEGALLDTISGDYNVGVGTWALMKTTSNRNVAVGANSLVENLGGYDNVAVGYSSLEKNTTGTTNIGIGRNAGRLISGGTFNETSANSIYIGYDSKSSADGNTNEVVIGDTAIGNGSNTVTIGNSSIVNNHFTGNITIEDTTASDEGAIFKDSTRFLHNYHHPTGGGEIPIGENIFLGLSAGNFTMGSTATQTYHASSNVGIGDQALDALTNGYRNIALGSRALSTIATDSNNIAIGYQAQTSATGSNNIAIGSSALSSVSGASNTGIGYFALYENTTGFNNIGIGPNAGTYITGGAVANQTSTNSIYLGMLTKAAADGNDNEIVIGYDVTGHGSDTVTIGNNDTNDIYLDGDVICSGLDISDTTASTEGVISKDGTRFLHNFHHPTGGGALPVGRNIFLGKNAGNFTAGSTATETYHGSDNIGIGYVNLDALTTGCRNISMGYSSLTSVTTGSNHVGIGYNSLVLAATSTDCTAVGASTLTYATGSNNTAIGSSSLNGITTGSNNIGIGPNAGAKITGGSTSNETSTYSTYIGRNTRASADGNTNEIVIGDQVTGNGSNTVTIGNDSTTDLYFNGDVTCSGVEANGDISIRVGDKIILDDDLDTYVYIPDDDKIAFYSSSVERLMVKPGAVEVKNAEVTLSTTGRKVYNSLEALNLGTVATTNHGLVTGDIICGGKAEFDDDVYMDADLEVSGVVSVNGQISSLIPTTLIPTGTTQTVDWNDGNMQVIDLDSATGDVTLTLSNPASGASYIIKTIQGGTARDLVFPASVLHQEGVTPTLSTAEDAIDVITMAYDGTYYLANTGKNYS